MKEGRKIQVPDPNEGYGGTGDEDTKLVQESVHGVEIAVLAKGGGLQREQQSGRYTLVDGVFGDVNQQKREHIRQKQRLGPSNICPELGQGIWAVCCSRAGCKEAGGCIHGRQIVLDVVLSQVLVRYGLVLFRAVALTERPLGEYQKETDKHDAGQESGCQQTVPDGEAYPIGEHDVQPGTDETSSAGTAPPGGEAHVTVVMG